MPPALAIAVCVGGWSRARFDTAAAAATCDSPRNFGYLIRIATEFRGRLTTESPLSFAEAHCDAFNTTGIWI